MILIQNLVLPLDGDATLLRRKAARLLKVSERQFVSFTIARQSVDARKKSDVHWVCAVQVELADEADVLRRVKDKNIAVAAPHTYRFPDVIRTSPLRPVVVGLGPAGLFSALSLARAGIPCTVLERGRDVDRRTADVEQFWETGKLDTSSNVQFGEGGAGTFSDGKLTTGTHDPRIPEVINTLIRYGAPEDVAYSHRPHIGTDILRKVVKGIRMELISLGCDVRFEHQLTGLHTDGGQLTGITVSCPDGSYSMDCDALILAPGHSARDTFAMLHNAGVPMQQKQFAIGVRIEHRQSDISEAQFGPAWEQLPAADYKLSCHLPSGRSAFTFCVCPGGQVVAAASESERLVTNGMSLRARDGENINGGFLVGVGPADFPGDDPLAGVRFQEEWEHIAWTLGGRNYHAPAQLVGDFLARRPSSGPASVRPTYRPGITWTDLDQCLPDYVSQTLRDALPLFARRVKGFDSPDAVLTGIETRSSSPVRIQRDQSFQSAIRGLYPCGEGAGYAGGIVSAAVDGIRVAEAVAHPSDADLNQQIK